MERRYGVLCMLFIISFIYDYFRERLYSLAVVEDLLDRTYYI